eukprot:CAMPEP_0176117998 /NCGR_PEP_ID=MMETSP0120_2-20121206/59289_1 /TAXON_ID=160619 /ORGANISM="Kryptoperidinium foliaceum, Strain CCMP 1326" /LENGTH=82 /DNA_ID=CAMNT_0017452311 /DNA_START=1 /DNA_END=245 /DNA_ORIENTATION=+
MLPVVLSFCVGYLLAAAATTACALRQPWFREWLQQDAPWSGGSGGGEREHVHPIEQKVLLPSVPFRFPACPLRRGVGGVTVA